MNIFRWTDQIQPLHGIALFRIIVGFMVCRHMLAFLQRYFSSGMYSAKFHVPYWDSWVIFSEPLYLLLMLLSMLGGFLIMIGFQTRWVTPITFALVTSHLFLNQFWYRHNRYFLVLCLLLLALSQSHKLFSWDSQQSPQSDEGYTWTHFLIRLQLTLIYIASAFSKTLDADWRSGKVLSDRGALWAEELQAKGGAQWAVDLLGNESLWKVMTIQALSTEYLLGIGLWIPWTRRLAVWCGILFHGYIEVAYSVLVFSYLTLATYLLVITPHKFNRILYYDPNQKWHRFWAACVQQLDWCQKVQCHPAKTSKIMAKSPDQKYYSGIMAIGIVGSAMVLPYFLTYPITWFRFFFGKETQAPELLSGKALQKAQQTPLKRFRTVWLYSLLVSYAVFLLWASGSSYWLSEEWSAVTLYFHHSRFTWIDFFLIFIVCWLLFRTYPQQSNQQKSEV